LTTFIFLPKIFAPQSEGAPFRLVGTERDERLPWRHELASYLAIAGHPRRMLLRAFGLIRLCRKNFPAASSPGLASLPDAAEYAIANLYFVATIFQSHPKSASFSVI
jgi:hypothetical protein